MLGMVLGVASLIVVLSVMNGFAGELRGRILSLVAHGYIESDSGALEGWRELRERVVQDVAVVAASPYISDKVILGSDRSLRGAVLTAIDPQLESEVSSLSSAITAGSLDSLHEDGFNVLLGVSLARMLGVSVGDRVDVTLPRLTVRARS